MNLTLLLDLDDTLLINDIDQFLPKYLEAFSRFVAPYIDPNRFLSALLTSTREMVENLRPDCTLQEVFEAAFLPKLGISETDFREIAEQFYSQVFPSLRNLTKSRPEAVALVEQTLSSGGRVVIATNPLFPETAIFQRLAWANLPVEKYPFEIVTTYETFHFSKPNPAYFAEVLSRIGWPNGKVIAVGDDLERDIIASRRMGLPAFWLSGNPSQSSNEPYAPTASGDLKDLPAWLKRTEPEALRPDYSAPPAILATLRATPAALDSLCRNLSEQIKSYQLKPGEWCVSEILCHLRDVEGEVNLPRVKKVLMEENPFLPGVDTDPWAEERNYIAQDGTMAFQQFTNTRMKLLDLLENMFPDDWQLPFRHAIFGPTSMTELIDIIAQHDRIHIQQVHKILNAIAKSN